MSVKGYFILQVCIPFILYSFGELVFFGVILNISTSIKSFGWIFGTITVLNFHKRHPVFGHQTIAYIIMAFLNMFAVRWIACILNQRSVFNIFINIVVYVLWTEFWNCFDNSLRNVIVDFRRKRIKIYQMFFQTFVWLSIFSCLGYCIRDIPNPLKHSTFRSLLCRYVNVQFVEIPRPDVIVESNKTKTYDERLNIQNNNNGIQSSFERGEKSPVCKRLFKRYIGEDVKIECKLFKKFDKVINYKSKWTHNGKELANSHKMKIFSYHGFYIIETLSIFLIDKDDFGKYQLWVSGIPSDIKRREYNKINKMVALMLLSQIADDSSYIKVPVGNGLLLFTHISYNFETEVLDLEYKIDSTLIGATSLDKNSERLFSGCSIFSFLFLHTAISLLKRNYDINKPLLVKGSNKVISVSAVLCTTELSLGKHLIYVTREFYNESTKTKQIVTTQLRPTFIVIPDESYNIFNKSYAKYNGRRFEHVDKSDILDEAKMLLFRQLLEIIMLIVIVFTLLIFCRCSIRQFNKHVISKISMYIFYLAGFEVESSSEYYLGNIVNENTYRYCYEYDVLILSTQDDNKFITENSIITCLEDRDYTVCFPERDFDAGNSIFQLFSKAIRNSNTIIVVCSKGFLEDDFMNTIVFGYFIMAEFDDKIDNKNILLIKKDKCNISTVLKRKYDFLDTAEIFSRNSCIREQVCAWVETRVYRHKYSTKHWILSIFIIFILCIIMMNSIACLFLKNIANLSKSPLLSAFISYESYSDCFGICFSTSTIIWHLRQIRSIHDERQRNRLKMLSLKQSHCKKND